MGNPLLVAAAGRAARQRVADTMMKERSMRAAALGAHANDRRNNGPTNRLQ